MLNCVGGRNPISAVPGPNLSKVEVSLSIVEQVRERCWGGGYQEGFRLNWTREEMAGGGL